jgi:UDP-N-acetylmuramoyl-tripeptide--D-alanyl-D-alanine ligase
MEFELKEILEATKGTLVQGQTKGFKGVGIDTRQISQGELFVAICGRQFDGHDFVEEAYLKGAGGAIVSKIPSGLKYKDFPLILVKDTKDALASLARARREKFSPLVIGITGSTGKTALKEILYKILRIQTKVLKSPESYNNLIGLPLTLLNLRSFHKIVILEMGTNAPGEIKRLCDIARPEIGIITNIAKVHLEGLGSIEGVTKEKAELFYSLPKHGIAIFNSDDVRVKGIAKTLVGIKTVGFGSPPAEVQLLDKKLLGFLGSKIKVKIFSKDTIELFIPLCGSHQIENVLAAIAVGASLNIDLNKIYFIIGGLTPLKGRFTIFKGPKESKLIDDTYNSNPRSLTFSLNITSDYGNKEFIAVLGDMKELGQESLSLHREMGKVVAKLNPSFLITYGALAIEIGKEAILWGLPKDRVKHLDTVEEIAKEIRQRARKDIPILVKGSRAMRMERIIELLK